MSNTRKPRSTRNTAENTDNLTANSENTTLDNDNKELIDKAAAVRGRRAQRAASQIDGDGGRTRRKFIGRKPKLDVSYFYDLYPSIFGGMVLRWVNDENAEVQRMEREDWIQVKLDGAQKFSERVNALDGSKQSSVVMVSAGPGKNHDHIYAILMMKDEEFFNEDERQYQRDQYDAQTRSLKGGSVSGQDGERVDNAKDGFYAPKISGGVEGMSIKKQHLQKG